MHCINPDSLAKPGGHYSHVVVSDRLVWISGQLPITQSGRKLNEASFSEQARQVLHNLQAALESAGCGVQDLLQVRVYVAGIAHWPEFNALYAEWIGPHRPARAVVPVPELHYGLLIEIEATAQQPADSQAS